MAGERSARGARAAVTLAAFTVLATSPGAASAEPTLAPPSGSHLDAPRDTRWRVAVIVVGEAGESLPSATRATLQVSLERALEADERLDVVDQDAELARRAGAVPDERISEARGLVIAGRALVDRGRAEPARRKLQAAGAQLAEVLPWVGKQELADAQYLLGAAQAQDGDRKAALATFTALLAWRPDHVADPEVAPAAALPVWDEAQDRALTLPRASLAIASLPEGAMAYIDGEFVGFTPTTVDDVTAAVHYVTVRQHGWQRAVVPVRVGDRKPARLRAVLQETPGHAELAALVDDVAGGIGGPQAPARVQAALGDLAALLEVEHLVALVAPGAGAERYVAHVYDVEGGRRLATGALTLGDQDPDDAFTGLARTLYARIGDADEGPGPRDVARDRRAAPWWSRWWFWTSIGAAAALGVTLPLVLGGGDDATGCPSGAGCGTVVLRF